MRTLFAATCIAIGLMALASSTAALTELEQKAVMSLFALLFDEEERYLLGQELDFFNKNFGLDVAEVERKFVAYETETWNNDHLTIKLDRINVPNSMTIEQFRGKYLGIFPIMNGIYTVEERIKIFENIQDTGILAELVFRTIVGNDQTVSDEEYLGLVQAITGDHNKTLVNVSAAWMKFNQGGPCTLDQFKAVLNTPTKLAKMCRGDGVF